MDFSQTLAQAAEKLILIEKPIKIISHIDTDGITSASILVRTLQKLDKNFSLSFVKQLSHKILSQLKQENYSIYIFLDLGSANIQEIKDNLKEKQIFILDHHLFQNIENDFIHINPHLFGINNELEISGSGIVYFLSKTINLENKNLSHLAIIGAIGDMQERKGFLGLNNEILQDSIDSNKIEVSTGLRMFGSYTRPLYKLLQYSTDPYIPGITGNEESTLKFLENLKINKEKKLFELDEEETKSLVTAIILQRLGSESSPEDVLGKIYLLKDEPEDSLIKDCREFSTLLNSCGRLNKPSLGVGACLNDSNTKQKALLLLNDYKKELINSLNWFYQSRNSPSIIEKENLVIINAEDNIRDTIIGTITSIISKSNLYNDGTILISLAHTLEEDTKISVRSVGKNNINLKEILSKITEKLNCKAGGHVNAAGSIIPQEKEQEFINLAQQILLENFIKPL